MDYRISGARPRAFHPAPFGDPKSGYPEFPVGRVDIFYLIISHLNASPLNSVARADYFQVYRRAVVPLQRHLRRGRQAPGGALQDIPRVQPDNRHVAGQTVLRSEAGRNGEVHNGAVRPAGKQPVVQNWHSRRQWICRAGPDGLV